ncbi:hypothetical protein CDL12_26280 [Handroanthus impetiginosus]|uniref:BHLH domain-containing protein n=1 Tax=Handroanthus impetiginosus TaxID=429701 RepID=A0A2G9G7E5_9LAMI|nr:hypothetical protein CDL12_26280 [Handroanthus impetiginosus]
MAEEFQGGICGGNWWSTSRTLFGSSPCSLATNDFGWMNHNPIIDMKTTRSSDDSAGSASDGSSSLVLQDARFSSATNPDAWNQDFLHDSGRSDQTYSNINLQEGAGLDWSSKNFSEQSSFNSFRQMNQSFPLEEPPLNSISNSTGFPLNSTSYSYTSSLLQTLFDTDSQPQQALLDNQAINYSSVSSSAANYDQVNNSNESFLPGLTRAAPVINPSFAKQNPITNLPFTNNANAPLWNAQFLPSSLNKKPNLPTFSTTKQQNEAARNLGSAAKKANNEPALKRPRIETPSPLPTFKVRKEKLGDRITALQQLVSPFGKTDTASVLHEAIEYIKYLHDQVSVYSAPYLKNGSSPLQRQQAGDKPKDQERQIQDLKSRGLCLVPISSTFPVAAETTADFWTPTFGGNFK